LQSLRGGSKEGKTYDDFRKAWCHTVGFGTSSKLYTVISANDPREIIVIGIVEVSLKSAPSTFRTDVKQRLDHSLDDVIEPGIGRQFGILVSEDYFSRLAILGINLPLSQGKKPTLMRCRVICLRLQKQ
jgi:hypothetical protein